jgi:hypothetical protein
VRRHQVERKALRCERVQRELDGAVRVAAALFIVIPFLVSRPMGKSGNVLFPSPCTTIVAAAPLGGLDPEQHRLRARRRWCSQRRRLRRGRR